MRLTAWQKAWFLFTVWRTWRREPSLRFGQLVVNALGRDDPFYVEDPEARARFQTYPVMAAFVAQDREAK